MCTEYQKTEGGEASDTPKFYVTVGKWEAKIQMSETLASCVLKTDQWKRFNSQCLPEAHNL